MLKRILAVGFSVLLLAGCSTTKSVQLENVAKDWCLSHGYIKNDFDVQEWAAPEFLEQAARELLEDEWKKRTTSKLPAAAASLASGGALG